MDLPGGSELFYSYNSEFRSLSLGVADKLRQLADLRIPVGSEEWKKIVRATEREIEECDEILSQMDYEIHAVHTGTRPKLNEVYRNAKSDLDQMRRDFQRICNAPSAREALLGPAGKPLNFEDPNSDPKAKLLQGTDQLNQTGERLTNANRIALESERTGIQTLQTLRLQREQLERTRNTLRDVDGNVDRAQVSLRSMARRLSSNKMVTYAIVIVLVLLIFLVIIIKIA